MNDDQSVADPAAEIGRALATGREVDLRGAALPAAVPPRLRPDGTARPSLDARAASVGKDMLCTGGFTAAGGVRIRRMEARKSVQFVDATLGTPGKPDAVYALNAYGPETPELVLRPAGAPAGRVRLARAQMGTFADAESLWAAAGGVDLDDFAYRTLHDPRGIDVRARLRMLEHALPDFVPGPYEQLAAAYRQGGDEELSEKGPARAAAAAPRRGRAGGPGLGRARCSTGRWGSATAPGRLLAPRGRVAVDLQRARHRGLDPRDDRGGGRGPDPRARLSGLRGWGTGAPEGVRRGRARGPRPPSGCPRPPPAPPR